MQAIETKYMGPTNARGGRVKATAQAGTVTIPWDHALDSEGNHAKAAATLMTKLGWDGPSYGSLQGGANAKGDGYVFVFCQTRKR